MAAAVLYGNVLILLRSTRFFILFVFVRASLLRAFCSRESRIRTADLFNSMLSSRSTPHKKTEGGRAQEKDRDLPKQIKPNKTLFLQRKCAKDK